jgi:hypothetical protein
MPSIHLLIILIFGLAVAVLAKCGTPPPSDEFQELHAVHAAKAEASMKGRDGPLKTITINTYCHVISTGPAVNQGNLKQKTVTKQVRKSLRNAQH